MKKIAVYVALLAVSLLLPLQGEELGKLLPVELVQIYKERNMIVITTDTGDSGLGETVDEAILDIKASTAGIVFLDTADYLLVSENAMEEASALSGHLKPSVRVCIAQQNMDLKQAAAYLSVHKPTVQLKNGLGGCASEKLIVENGRLYLKEI